MEVGYHQIIELAEKVIDGYTISRKAIDLINTSDKDTMLFASYGG